MQDWLALDQASVEVHVHTVVEGSDFVGVLWLGQVGDEGGLLADIVIVGATALAALIILHVVIGKDILVGDF